VAYGRGQDDSAIEINSGFEPVFSILVAVLVLGAIGFVVARSVNAHRRGEDAGRAAARAARAVAPPLVIAVLCLVALSVLAGLVAVFFLIAVIAALAGEPETVGNLFLVMLLGSALLLVALVGAGVWAVVRVLRLRRERG
jgi:hypothetical protein